MAQSVNIIRGGEESSKMITLKVIIKERDNELLMGFQGNDDGGCTELEADTADRFREILKSFRAKIAEERGETLVPLIPERYSRTFTSEKNRDKNYEEN